MKLAALGDLHIGKSVEQRYEPLFQKISQEADVLLLCGDLTNRGLREEVELLASELISCTIPVVAVLGNHDYDHDHQENIAHMLRERRVIVLEGDSTTVKGVGFAGSKGFIGGFDGYMMQSFGEQKLKEIVAQGVDEALALEQALGRLETDKKVVLLHYAPIRATVVGEPPEIFPLLGSTRLEGPCNRLGASVVFHGHAHHGAFSGKTSGGVPVFNVSLPVLKREGKDYFLFEV